MAKNSKIEWCDHTFNPWIGCTAISPGCDNCYAEAMMDTRLGRVAWGAKQDRLRTSVANWRQPIKWNVEAERTGTRPRVFCASLSDWLDNDVPIEWLVDLLDLIRCTPNLDWLLLTKRIGNWETRVTQAHQHICRAMGPDGDSSHPLWALGMWLQDWLGGRPPANVWLGATVVNQTEADRDIQKLLKASARVRFLSMEPLLLRTNIRGHLLAPAGADQSISRLEIAVGAPPSTCRGGHRESCSRSPTCASSACRRSARKTRVRRGATEAVLLVTCQHICQDRAAITSHSCGTQSTPAAIEHDRSGETHE